MRSAFKKVSEALKFDYHPNDPMTDLIVTKITERVNDGEIDPDRITDQVLIEIAELQQVEGGQHRASSLVPAAERVEDGDPIEAADDRRVVHSE